MSRTDYFADLVLPLSLPNLFTYRIPQGLNDKVRPGMRVVAQFGKNKLYAAIVWKVHETAPSYTTKYIDSVLDEHPVVTELQLEFWDWMSKYYLCAKGEVMLAALPSGLRLTSETRIILNPHWEGDRKELDDEAFSLCEALDVRATLTLEDISAILDKKTVYPVIRKLLDIGVVLVYEEIQQRYQPKYETYVRLADEYVDEEKLKEVFAQLEKRSFKQLQLLMAYVHLSERYSKNPKAVRKSDLLKSSGAGCRPTTGLADSDTPESGVVENVGVAVKIASPSLSVQKLLLLPFLAVAILHFPLPVFDRNGMNVLREILAP